MINQKPKLVRLVPVALAAVLQLLPIGRVTLLSQAIAPSSFAVVWRWTAGATALLGGYDAVSGASAAVSGMVKYMGTTPVGGPTNAAAEPVGQAFKYRITVTNAGRDHQNDYYNCLPLPSGLTINTNTGGNGYITGVPTTPGTYPVTLYAGNTSYPQPVAGEATILILPAVAAPVIVTQPQSQTVTAGAQVTFAMVVSGTAPLSYQWKFNTADLPGATSSRLMLTNVQTSQAGDYSVVVSNKAGSVTSSVARLTFQVPLLLELRLHTPGVVKGQFQFLLSGPIHTNFVIWASADLIDWSPLQTNRVVDGTAAFADLSQPLAPCRFYRATLAP